MCKPNSEAIAVANLTRQGFDCYLPRIKLAKPNKAVATRPLFPRYLFVFVQDLWYSIQGTRGVSYVLLGSEGPLQVNSQIIQSLKSREDDEGFVVLGNLKKSERFERGQPVKAIEGPFVGLPMVYEGMTAQERVKVLLAILGRQVYVDVDDNILVPACA